VIEAAVDEWLMREVELLTMLEVHFVIEDVVVRETAVFWPTPDPPETDSGHDVETTAVESAEGEQTEVKASS
jgi:hypothetical protein